MNAGRAIAAPLGLAVVAGLAGCFSTAPRPPVSTTAPPELAAPPPMPDSAGDVVPRVEARARSGNPPFYDVFGKRYYVLSSSTGYWERGVASWYGPGFHKVRTSTGETYDMYGMSAAHKTLPLPAYVRVTNLQNGRSVVVRVNDRGPFVSNRIIDLSYTAAARLDMLRKGTAMVEVRTIDPSAAPPVLTASTSEAAGDPGATPSAGASAGAGLFVQAGAFSDPANAQRLADKLHNGSYGKVFVREDQIAGRRMYRVRIGPVPDVGTFDRVVAALERAGITDAHLALD